MSTLEINDLHVSVDTEDGPKEILKGVTLTIKAGEAHAIMGPNGSGKSTLAYSIAGHPKYTITCGTVTLDGADVLAMTVDERARAGLFLAMQYPVEVPGVSVANFLRTAKTAIDGEAPKLRTWVKDVNATMEQAGLDPSFSQRNVNEGFSGGEKKRHEIAQLELLDPKVAILDETDSGLDIDALKVVSEGVNRFAEDDDKARAADHPLHADPALHQARLRPRVRRRPDRRRGRPGARRPARGRGLRQVRRRPRRPSDDRCPACSPIWRSCARTSRSWRARLAGGQPLVYLDSANTSQKPQVVIDTMVDHLERHNANIARAMHTLGAESTEAFEGARDKVAAFIGAPSRDEVIFTKNITEALNLLANTFAWAEGDLRVGPGDEVVITEMEHHSNIVPWQLLTERTGATLRWFGITDDGLLDLSNIDELITERTKVVSLTWVSNMLGTINPIRQIADRAHEVGAVVIVDAAQAVPQLPVDVVESGADFVAFTGHKCVGPTGIGVLWGTADLLDRAAPVPRRRRDDRDRHDGAVDVRQGAPQVRGRHAADRRGGRPRRGRRLPRPRRHGRHPRPRAGDHRATRWRAWPTVPGLTVLGPLDPTLRGGADQLRDRRGAPPRRGAGARLARDRGPRRPQLREAGPRPVRGAELDPDVVVPLHDAGRDRRLRRGAGIRPVLLQVGLTP